MGPRLSWVTFFQGTKVTIALKLAVIIRRCIPHNRAAQIIAVPNSRCSSVEIGTNNLPFYFRRRTLKSRFLRLFIVFGLFFVLDFATTLYKVGGDDFRLIFRLKRIANFR